MRVYRVSVTVNENDLSELISQMSPESVMVSEVRPPVQLAEPKPATAVSEAPKRTTKRMTKGNGAEWPAPGSIYDTVLQAIKKKPHTPTELRDVLAAAGFSSGSVNSALGRLEKANKARRGEGGWVAA